MRVTLDTLGVQAVSRDLVRFGDRASDVSPVMGQVFDVIRGAERRQFDSQGGDGSGGWQPLAASTVIRKQRLGLDPRILRATGDLFNAMTGETDSAQIAVERHDGGDFGTTLPYAGMHQKGGGHLPARPVVQLPERDRRDIIKTVQRFILETGR